MKTIYVCEDCGSEEVQSLEWVNINTGISTGGNMGDLQDQWCDNCKEHKYAITKKEYEKINMES